MCRNICSANSRIEQDFSLLPSRIQNVSMTLNDIGHQYLWNNIVYEIEIKYPDIY